MLYLALFFLISTFILGLMSLGAVASGSLDLLATVFYISAGMFFIFLLADFVRKEIRERKSRAVYAKKLEDATRGVAKS